MPDRPPLTEAAVYLDTVEVFFRYRPKGLLHALQGRVLRPPWYEDCKDPHGNLWGHRLIVQQPKAPRTLSVLDQWQRQHGGKLCRFDLALDLLPRPEDHEALRRWIEHHATLRWRRPGRMHDDHGTLYWVRQTDRIEWGSRRSNRDMVVYSDRHSKITGEVDCVHLELKFYNTPAIRKAGFSFAKQLIAIEPLQLFERHVKLMEADQLAQLASRDAIKADRARYRPTPDKEITFTDRYRATIHRRVQSMFDRIGVQRIKDLYRKDRHLIAKLKPIPLAVLQIPNRLSWPP